MDEEILEANSYLDKLDFTKSTFGNGNEFAFLKLEVSENECKQTDFLTCTTSIPVPEKGTLESNSFGFTSGYQFAGETEQIVGNLLDEVKWMLPWLLLPIINYY